MTIGALPRIAIDTMGGDFGPSETIPAAIESAKSGTVAIILVGSPDLIKKELAKYSYDNLPITIIPSDGLITETTQPVQAIKKNPNASIVICNELVKRKDADAYVTMGSTGAALASSSMILGLLDNIDRPVLGGVLLECAPHSILVDAGSTIDARPSQLVNFAVLGSAFVQAFFGINNPKVALLSVGSENNKGNKQVKDTYGLLEKTNINFIGNIEGHELPFGKADVIVCDGFTGNILLKTVEGIGSVLYKELANEIGKHLPEKKANHIAEIIFKTITPADKWGGSPIFGINGIGIVGHGRHKQFGIRNAINTAKLSIDVNMIEIMENNLKRIRDKIKVNEI
jgi:glycerol-3-phosphate acyltransferase PlsX